MRADWSHYAVVGGGVEGICNGAKEVTYIDWYAEGAGPRRLAPSDGGPRHAGGAWV
jgi:hypothetical protein